MTVRFQERPRTGLSEPARRVARPRAAVWSARSGMAVWLMAAAAGPAGAQAVDLERLRLAEESQRIGWHMGQEALIASGGTAWLDDVDLQDVVIEVDVALPDAFGFAGVLFRAVDDLNHEYYYLRAHQSGREDATQYMPIVNGLGSWQIHTGPAFAAPLRFTHERWMHLKLVAVGDALEIYLDSNEPVQVARLLRSPRSGAIGLAASGGADTRFANLRIRAAGSGDLDPGTLRAMADAEEETYAGSERREPAPGAALVERFRVSSPFPEDLVREPEPLDPAARPWSDLGWNRIQVEREGIADLARLHGNQEGNTVFAAVTLTSDRPRTVPVRLGFSDRARVFLNGRPVFAGADEWRTRDFRFLGTVGLHDTLFLPLEAGENALWIAVSEDFGGWAVMLEVPELEGLAVTP